MRGRKKGTKNGQFRAWQPVRWHPHYDIIVARAFNGESNIVIAADYKITPVQVSNILNSELGRCKIYEYARKQKTAIVHSIDERVTKLAEKAYDRIEKVINNEELFNNNPFSVFDRSLKVLQTVGSKTPFGTIDSSASHTLNIQNNNTLLVALKNGLDQLEEVKKIHGNNNTERLLEKTG